MYMDTVRCSVILELTEKKKKKFGISIQSEIVNAYGGICVEGNSHNKTQGHGLIVSKTTELSKRKAETSIFLNQSNQLAGISPTQFSLKELS